MKRIFLLEDDPSLGYLLKDYLENIGYGVQLVVSGEKATEIILKDPFDICILDVMVPHTDGFSIAATLKKKFSDTPIIFLTARSRVEDRIRGLKLGADDYLTKPFSMEELELRIKAILNRVKDPVISGSDIIQIGNLEYNREMRELTYQNNVQRLSKKEASLLWMLLENKNQVVKRDTILEKIWNFSDYYTARSMDVYIAKLRKLLKSDPALKIENLHGTGFRLTVEE